MIVLLASSVVLLKLLLHFHAYLYFLEACHDIRLLLLVLYCKNEVDGKDTETEKPTLITHILIGTMFAFSLNIEKGNKKERTGQILCKKDRKREHYFHNKQMVHLIPALSKVHFQIVCLSPPSKTLIQV